MYSAASTPVAIIWRRLTSTFPPPPPVLQVDTKDILFICGGAFVDLDRQVADRTQEASLGFGNPVRSDRQPLQHLTAPHAVPTLCSSIFAAQHPVLANCIS